MKRVDSLGWSESLSIWRSSLSNPSEKYFRKLAKHPSASIQVGTHWLFWSVAVFFSLQQIETISWRLYQNIAINPWTFLYIPLAPFLLANFAFLPMFGLSHILSKWFGGRGNIEKTAFVYSSIFSPTIIILWLLRFTLHFVSINFLIYLFVLYVLFLAVFALNTLYNLSWIKAVIVFVISSLISGIVAISFLGILSGFARL